MNDRVFIEEQFPVSKVSKESYKERKAVQSQTLTGLGKWWGRKPLVVVRAAIIGMLMPTSDNPKKDRDIFLKIMTMDDDGLWKRRSKSISTDVLKAHLSPDEWNELLLDPSGKLKPSWSTGLSPEEKDAVIRKAFDRMSYDEKLTYCDRPEQIEGPDEKAWKAINDHLGAHAASLQELVVELGKRRFGHVPKVGDAFCGGGSITFEAARLGCEAYGSDLNPFGVLLTWAAIHLVGGDEDLQEEIKRSQNRAFELADQQIIKWGIETNSQGWRADAFLYCTEVLCPSCKIWVPLASAWVIGPTSKVVAELRVNKEKGKFDIDVVNDATQEQIEKAKSSGTISNGRMICPSCGMDHSLSGLRGDVRSKGNSTYGLRLWKNEDLSPRAYDLLQERLYCVRWVEKYWEENDQGEMVHKTRRHFRSVDAEDLAREEKVLKLLRERFAEWQEKGFIPSKKIERGGAKTEEPIRTRGWTHWHHLFTPRQLLIHGLIGQSFQPKKSDVGILLGLSKIANWDSKLCGWGVGAARESIAQTFYNQAFNTLYNFAGKGLSLLKGTFFLNLEPKNINTNLCDVRLIDARKVTKINDIWITDPPYADAIYYHELADFSLAWHEKNISRIFPEWYTDPRSALAVKGSGLDFKQSMVEIYEKLTKHMPDNGIQLVMFTHQNASVWADLAMILWAAGLRVTAAWTIATETAIGIKQGNYVQGTVLLILRKRTTSETVFIDEVYPEIEDEVRRQLDQMVALDDREDPNFADTDYQLAAYAAALRVLTSYSEIEGHDIRHELFRHKQTGEESAFEQVINRAVEIASDHLVPKGLETRHWKALQAPERLYLKGLELEKNGEMRAGAYQELAKGFGVKDYTGLYHKAKANAVRFKTGTEFKKAGLGNGEFGSTPLRNILFAIHETVHSDDARQGLNWLRDEVPTYWQIRKQIVAVLNYLAALANIPHMPHWEKDADAAQRLAGAVANDHAGVL
jgi:putative DNA methylase